MAFSFLQLQIVKMVLSLKVLKNLLIEVDKFCSLKQLDGIIFTVQAPFSGYWFSRLIIPTK